MWISGDPILSWTEESSLSYLYKDRYKHWTPAFPLGFWNMDTCQAEVPVQYAPTTTPGSESPMSFPVWQHPHCWGSKHILWLLKACAWLPPHVVPCIAFLCCLALYPFTVINHSHECNCALSPVSPPSKSLNLRVAVRNPTWVTNEHNQILLESTNISLFSKGYSRVLIGET